jgi:hypothetical protein
MLQGTPRTVRAWPPPNYDKAPLCSQLWKPQSGEAFLKQSEIETDPLSE